MKSSDTFRAVFNSAVVFQLLKRPMESFLYCLSSSIWQQKALPQWVQLLIKSKIVLTPHLSFISVMASRLRYFIKLEVSETHFMRNDDALTRCIILAFPTDLPFVEKVKECKR